MKVREGFVSNSSSTSFVIRSDDITHEQKYFILHHEVSEGDTGWYVNESYGFIFGHTSAHRYDMGAYLQRILGEDKDCVLWANT